MAIYHRTEDGRVLEITITEKGRRLCELAEKDEAGTLTAEEKTELFELEHGKIN